MLERLADLIRPASAYRPGVTPGEPPPGAADNEGFVPTVSMTSLVGCSGEDFGSILKSLGYVMERRAGPPITVPLAPAVRRNGEAPAAPEEQAATAAQDPAAPSAPSGDEAGQASDMSVASDGALPDGAADRKSTRLNSSHANISYAVFC